VATTDSVRTYVVTVGQTMEDEAVSEMTDRFELVAAGFDRRVQAVSPDKWGAQSPCDEWTARDVVGHVVRNYRSIAAEATGGEGGPMGEDEDPVEAWSGAYGQMSALAKDPEALTKNVRGPGGPTPLEQAMGTLISMDTSVHTWDLARAVGGDERLDPDVVHLAREMLEPMDAMIRQPGVFGPKLDPPAGADEQTQLLYFLGRRA
jgi:uncharacterized protein (TIGR03086 family)